MFDLYFHRQEYAIKGPTWEYLYSFWELDSVPLCWLPAEQQLHYPWFFCISNGREETSPAREMAHFARGGPKEVLSSEGQGRIPIPGSNKEPWNAQDSCGVLSPWQNSSESNTYGQDMCSAHLGPICLMCAKRNQASWVEPLDKMEEAKYQRGKALRVFSKWLRPRWGHGPCTRL